VGTQDVFYFGRFHAIASHFDEGALSTKDIEIAVAVNLPQVSRMEIFSHAIGLVSEVLFPNARELRIIKHDFTYLVWS
jgi:hypothetical protein